MMREAHELWCLGDPIYDYDGVLMCALGRFPKFGVPVMPHDFIWFGVDRPELFDPMHPRIRDYVLKGRDYKDPWDV